MSSLQIRAGMPKRQSIPTRQNTSKWRATLSSQADKTVDERLPGIDQWKASSGALWTKCKRERLKTHYKRPISFHISTNRCEQHPQRTALQVWPQVDPQSTEKTKSES